jgi:hypothetical protein
MATHSLTVSLKSPDFHALNTSLYSPEHGFGERTLALRMTSRSSRYHITLPLICRYKDNVPSLLTDKVVRSTWELLCELAGELAGEQPFLRVELSHGPSYYFVRVAMPGKVPLEDERTEVSLVWQEYDEYDEAKEALKKGLGWVKEKLV